ncbi:amino acid ABC transporter permease [Siccirubricoccus phaeus]|uniref:amino acid ABC transporter permease n=1 Tax=Siccirubricoccus phaeus TaxID=2595053 RepID=UPI001F46DC26|nr:amino acid ABC transporter permease [Siccirubricoccus phaeus]
MGYVWQWQMIWDYRQVFYRGVEVTAILTFWALLIGMALGLVLGLMRSSRAAWLRVPAAVYIDVFRATPILVQLVWIYYALPILTGVQMGNIASASVGIGLHAAAYIAEIFRAGIASIDRGQSDAAKSLGMSYGQAMRRIILPQAVRRMVPPFINEFATLMKLTTLGSVLAVNELLHEAENLINNTYRPLETYTVVAIVFGLLIYPFIWLSQRLEQHWKTRG